MATPLAEVEVDAELVRALLSEQHPDLARLPLVRFASGWDNVIYRLGDDLTVRLPGRALAASLVLHEQRWLPELAVDLPLPVPVPVRVGVPGCGFPWPWHVGPWFPGEPAEHRRPDDMASTASSLGRFLAALHRPAPSEAPANPFRGTSLADRSDRLHEGIVSLGSSVDADRALGLWRDLVDTPGWPGPPLWIHGDVHPLNLIVHGGRLSAVIDFGDVAAGDPASDLAVAWMLFPADHRPTFRRASGADAGTWTRARGWALALGVAMANGDDRVAAIGRRTLNAALADDAA